MRTSDQAKARKAIAVPLNAEAIQLIGKQVGKHPTHVFSFRGSRLIGSERRLGTSRSRARASRISADDLRHTWASLHVQSGTPLFVLQELGGWQSPAMVRRYARLMEKCNSGQAADSANMLPTG